MNGTALSLSAFGVGSTTATVGDASGVSFSQQIVPIFRARCTGCHGNSGNLTLTPAQAYSNLVNVPAQTGPCAGLPRVLPGNSAQSALYRRVAGTCSDRMPLGGSLTTSEIELIRQWIDQGSLNN